MESSGTAGGADELTTMRKHGGEHHKEKTAADCSLWMDGTTADLDLFLSLSKRRLSMLMERELKESRFSGSSNGDNWSLRLSAKPCRKVSHLRLFYCNCYVSVLLFL